MIAACTRSTPLWTSVARTLSDHIDISVGAGLNQRRTEASASISTAAKPKKTSAMPPAVRMVVNRRSRGCENYKKPGSYIAIDD